MASSRGVDGQNCKTDIMGMGLQDTRVYRYEKHGHCEEREDGMASQPAEAAAAVSKRRRRGGQQYCEQRSRVSSTASTAFRMLGVRDGPWAGVRFSGARGGG